MDKIKVLIAEDMEPIRKRYVKILNSAGDMEVCADVGSGEEAVMQQSLQDADVILMDIRMPVMDGYEAARRMQQAMEEKHRRISIIAMSADVFQEELQQASQAGMDGFVSKPIDPGRLRQALLQAIGEK